MAKTMGQLGRTPSVSLVDRQGIETVATIIQIRQQTNPSNNSKNYWTDLKWADNSGASDQGSGTGAGGEGTGTGSGAGGGGQGGGIATDPVLVSGRIDDARDYPAPPGGRAARRGTEVVVRVMVGTDGVGRVLDATGALAPRTCRTRVVLKVLARVVQRITKRCAAAPDFSIQPLVPGAARLPQTSERVPSSSGLDSGVDAGACVFGAASAGWRGR